MIELKFYKELGKLLYAVAKADGIIQQPEQDAVEKFVHKALTHHKIYFNLHPEAKNIVLTKLSFHNARKSNMEPKQCLQSYLDFFKKYGNSLTMDQKKVASDLINKVASASKGLNNSETSYLNELASCGLFNNQSMH